MGVEFAELSLVIRSDQTVTATARLKDLEKAGGRVERSTERVRKRFLDTNKAAAGFARNMKVLLGTFVGFHAARQGIRTIADFEQGLVGIGKTTELVGKELQAVSEGVLRLAQVLPNTTAEMLDAGVAAGQLGVRGVDNILAFIETITKLGLATDLHGANAALVLARLLNITGESISSVKTLGSVITRLGNEYAALEPEIATAATRVAQATAGFKISSDQILALATAMRALGIVAELGGSSLGRTFNRMERASLEAGEKLKFFAEIAGKSMEDFRKSFEEDPVDTFVAFAAGLGELTKEGISTAAALRKVGIEGIRDIFVLRPLAKNIDLLRRALATAADEKRKNTELDREAARAADTLGSEFGRLRNSMVALLNAAGEGGLNKELRSMAKFLAQTIRIFAGMTGAVEDATANVRLFVRVLRVLIPLLVTLIATKLIVFFVTAARSVFGLVTAFKALTLAIKANPIGLIITLLVSLGIAFFTFSKDIGFATSRIEEFNKALDELPRTLADARDIFDRGTSTQNIEDQIRGLRLEIEVLDRASLKMIKVRRELFEKEGVSGTITSVQRLKKIIDGLDVSKLETAFGFLPGGPEGVLARHGIEGFEPQFVDLEEAIRIVGERMRFLKQVVNELGEQLVETGKDGEKSFKGLIDPISEARDAYRKFLADLVFEHELAKEGVKDREKMAALRKADLKAQELLAALGRKDTKAERNRIRDLIVDTLELAAARKKLDEGDKKRDAATVSLQSLLDAFEDESRLSRLSAVDKDVLSNKIAVLNLYRLVEIENIDRLLASMESEIRMRHEVAEATKKQTEADDEREKAADSVQEIIDKVETETRLMKTSGLERKLLALEIQITNLNRKAEISFIEELIFSLQEEIRAQHRAKEERKKLDAEIKREEKLFKDLGSSAAKAFEDMVLGAKTAQEAIADLIRELSRLVFQKIITEPLANAIAGGFSNVFSSRPNTATAPGSGGGAFLPDNQFARGGILHQATMFPMAGGRLGLAGEAGPEAIAPLGRTAQGDLGIKIVEDQRTRPNQTFIINMKVVTPDVGGFRQSSKMLGRELRRIVGGN